jgi:hypothetical protein
MKLPPARPFGLELNQTAHACGKEKEKSPGGRNLPGRQAWRSAGGIAGRNVGIERVGTDPARARLSVARLLRHGEKVIAEAREQHDHAGCADDQLHFVGGHDPRAGAMPTLARLTARAA